jgi:hypothetical protein
MIGSREPVAPIGFNLEIAIALVPGMAAREVAVAALRTVYALQSTSVRSAALQQTALPTRARLSCRYVFAPQCLASLAVADGKQLVALDRANDWLSLLDGLRRNRVHILASVSRGSSRSLRAQRPNRSERTLLPANRGSIADNDRQCEVMCNCGLAGGSPPMS